MSNPIHFSNMGTKALQPNPIYPSSLKCIVNQKWIEKNDKNQGCSQVCFATCNCGNFWIIHVTFD